MDPTLRPVLPETFAAVGYPGPLEAMFRAVNA